MSASPCVVTHRRSVHLRTCRHATQIAFPMSWSPLVAKPRDRACGRCLDGILPTDTTFAALRLPPASRTDESSR